MEIQNIKTKDELSNIFGKLIKIKDKRKIIFEGSIQKIAINCTNNIMMLSLNGIEKFENKKAVVTLLNNKPILLLEI